MREHSLKVHCCTLLRLRVRLVHLTTIILNCAFIEFLLTATIVESEVARRTTCRCHCGLAAAAFGYRGRRRGEGASAGWVVFDGLLGACVSFLRVLRISSSFRYEMATAAWEGATRGANGLPCACMLIVLSWKSWIGGSSTRATRYPKVKSPSMPYCSNAAMVRARCSRARCTSSRIRASRT